MKKILMSTVVLFLFSLSIILFQIACKKDASADTNAPATTSAQVGKLLYTKYDGATSSSLGIFTSNYDGTGETKINIVGSPISGSARFDEIQMSPDGKTLFFTVENSSNAGTIYSCNIDGTNLKVVKAGTGGGAISFDLEQAY